MEYRAGIQKARKNPQVHTMLFGVVRYVAYPQLSYVAPVYLACMGEPRIRRTRCKTLVPPIYFAAYISSSMDQGPLLRAPDSDGVPLSRRTPPALPDTTDFRLTGTSSACFLSRRLNKQGHHLNMALPPPVLALSAFVSWGSPDQTEC